jgi:hypothetical protein
MRVRLHQLLLLFLLSLSLLAAVATADEREVGVDGTTTATSSPNGAAPPKKKKTTKEYDADALDRAWEKGDDAHELEHEQVHERRIREKKAEEKAKKIAADAVAAGKNRLSVVDKVRQPSPHCVPPRSVDILCSLSVGQGI